MKSNLLKHTESIAVRLVLGRDDAVARCRAEQDFRALAFCAFLRALRHTLAVAIWASADAVSTVVSALRHSERLSDDNSPAMR